MDLGNPDDCVRRGLALQMDDTRASRSAAAAQGADTPVLPGRPQRRCAPHPVPRRTKTGVRQVCPVR
ncbi:hypothetical protein [Xanthomonas arboricola]|uniref:hypothetical protein n=1 Tax=Xanthomonas arboricola TaxID=56448 RepID=UPI000E0FACE6|nr:hypothetical protein [Xanthomonas arboricola]